MKEEKEMSTIVFTLIMLWLLPLIIISGIYNWIAGHCKKIPPRQLDYDEDDD